MRVRKVDASGDMTFGQNQGNFWRDEPEAVGQVVVSRLHLWEGEWYLDPLEGTSYQYRVLGKRTETTRDLALRARMIDSPGVAGVADFSSVLDRQARRLAIAATLRTIYPAQGGQALSSNTTRVATSVYQDR